MHTATDVIDPSKLDAFLGQIVGDAGAAMSAALVVLGDRLGLYAALAQSPATAAELAARTQTKERYVQEWLDAQAAGGYLAYDPSTARYRLPPEQREALANPQSPAFVPGFFQIAAACWAAVDRMSDRFKTREGPAWCEPHH